MSNVTLQKVWDAAKRFVEDDKELEQLIEAIKVHRTDELANPTPAAEPVAEETPTAPPAA